MLNAPLIKICGIQNSHEAADAIRAGATMIGFLVGLTHRAEDGITEDKAADIIRTVPPSVRTVMVTHLLDADRISRIAQDIGANTIQIHDDLPVEDCARLKKNMPGTAFIKAIHVQSRDAIRHAAAYAGVCDSLLLDSRTADRLGGTGQTHDWNISRDIVNAMPIPVILAGGLNPGNVTDAIQKVRPAGIDANSGLENLDGSKNFEKMAAFASAGKTCHDSTNIFNGMTHND